MVKYKFYIILVAIDFYSLTFLSCSCSNKKEESHSIYKNSDSVKYSKEDTSARYYNHNTQSSQTTIYDTMKIESKFNSPYDVSNCLSDSIPLGSKVLISHEFPQIFEVHPLKSNGDNKPNVKEFYDVIHCYSLIGKGKKTSYPFYNYGYEFIQILNEITETDSNANILNSYSIKLPDFGPYQCFYSYQEDDRNYVNDKGYIFLYSGNNKITKVIKVYNSVYEEASSSCVCFYIDSNKRIHLFQFFIGENEVRFSKVCTIDILNTGEIKIK